MCYCHDKRLCFYLSFVRLFLLSLSLLCFFVLSSQNGRLFVFLGNTGPSIEILKIQIFGISRPYFAASFVAKTFSPRFLCRRKVALCQSGRMAHTPRTVPINVPIDRITPGFRQVVLQFSIIDLTNRIRK